jgi:hypothetical protein
MATFARWSGVAVLASLTLLGVTPRRADAVINPLFMTPFGVNPYFRVRPGLTLAQAYYNAVMVGQAYAQIPPYALGYNPYISMYAPPVAPAYRPGYLYPGSTFSGYGSAYVPMTPGYASVPPANPYIPQPGLSTHGAHKGLERLAGLTKADGSLAWPLGLRVLPPAAETDRLRQKISTEVLGTVNSAEEGKAARAAVQQVTHDIHRIEALLNERAGDVPLTDQAMSDARRFLHSLKDRLKSLPTQNE